MNKNITKFDDTEIEEYKFHQNKSPIFINDIDINKIVVSNKLPFCKQDFRCFIGYKDSEKIRPFDENRRNYFIIKNERKSFY